MDDIAASALPEISPETRAQGALRAVAGFKGRRFFMNDEETTEAIGDLLCDMRHLVDRLDPATSWEALLRRADMHYMAEREDATPEGEVLVCSGCHQVVPEREVIPLSAMGDLNDRLTPGQVVPWGEHSDPNCGRSVFGSSKATPVPTVYVSVGGDSASGEWVTDGEVKVVLVDWDNYRMDGNLADYSVSDLVTVLEELANLPARGEMESWRHNAILSMNQIITRRMEMAL